MTQPDIIVIGGSSGSIPVLITLMSALPVSFPIPIVIIVHRMRNVESDLKSVIAHVKEITEPEDKEPVLPGNIYLAPQNYHLLAEDNRSFSLDYSELVNYSRPSIDVSFMSISSVYKEGTLGILLSGANADGAAGIDYIISNGGMGIAQDPATAESPTMPEAAIKINSLVKIHTPQNIVNILLNITHTHQ